MDGAGPDVPGYEVGEVLGRGGFGTVYAAVQHSVGRTVALKVVPVAGFDDETMRRFRAETATVGALSWHPHVVPLYDAGVTPAGVAFLAMEMLPEGSLGDRVRGGEPLAPELVIRHGRQVADALAAAHAAGILHRDIKPDNLLLSARGDVKLADFGVATLTDATRTATGLFTGTIAYSAPELLDGARADVRSEVYSLGATLHALAAGRAPFGSSGDTPLALLASVARGERTPLPRHVPTGLASLIDAMLRRDPDARPTEAEVMAALDALAVPASAPTAPRPGPTEVDPDATVRGPVSGQGPPSDTTPTVGGGRRTVLAATLGAMLLVAAVVVGTVLLRGDRGSSLADDRPRRTTAGRDVSPDADEPGTSTEGTTEPAASGCEPASPIDVSAADAPTVTSPGGPDPTELGIEDITVGEGHAVANGDSVQVQYTGVLFSDGTRFDSSWDTGLVPFPVTVGAWEVIEGFDAGLVGMRPGGRRRLTIPADQAYGRVSPVDSIPPGSALVFVIDLVQVCSPDPAG